MCAYASMKNVTLNWYILEAFSKLGMELLSSPGVSLFQHCSDMFSSVSVYIYDYQYASPLACKHRGRTISQWSG